MAQSSFAQSLQGHDPITENQPVQLKLVLSVIGGLISLLIAIAAWQFGKVTDRLDENREGQIQLVEAVKYMTGSIGETNRRLDQTNAQLSGIADRLDGKDGMSKDILLMSNQVQNLKSNLDDLKHRVVDLEKKETKKDGG